MALLKDTITKEYMSDNDKFADIFNYFVFGGRDVIHEASLKEMDPTELSVILYEDKSEVIQKFRDILKSCVMKEDQKVTYLLLGLENQSDIHYAMVVRNMLYDALNYGKQVKKTANEHRISKDIKQNEFLSGFKKTDKLKPIITLTLYWGSKQWDGPRSLYEMFEPMDVRVMNCVNDYKLNLVVPKDVQDFGKFKTELGTALNIIAVSDDLKELKAFCREFSTKTVSRKTMNLVNVCTGMKIHVDESQEDKINVGNAFLELREEGKLEGKIEGKIEGRVLAYYDMELSIEEISEKVHVPIETVKEILDKADAENDQ